MSNWQLKKRGIKMTMKAEKKVEINLSMSEGDAEWLRGYLQNSKVGSKEPESIERRRIELFTVLKKILDNE